MHQQLRPVTVTHQQEVVVCSLFEGDVPQLLLVQEDNEVRWFADFLWFGVAHRSPGQVAEGDDVPLLPVVRVLLPLQQESSSFMT